MANEQPPSEQMSAEEVFALVGHEIRVEIIHALWKSPEDSVSFSELRSRVEIADSGQFNYHLGRLVGTFVQQTSNGYELTYAGRRVIGAILDGTFTRNVSIGPFDTEVRCHSCETSLEASYEHDTFTLKCPHCGVLVSQFDCPPGLVENHEREELLRAGWLWARSRFLLIVNGVCPNCAGRMQLRPLDDSDTRPFDVLFEYDCQRCMERATSTIGWYLSYHPVVISYCYDHGIDLREPWLGVQHLSAGLTVVEPTERPLTVEFTLADEKLRLTLDTDLDVVEHQRI